MFLQIFDRFLAIFDRFLTIFYRFSKSQPRLWERHRMVQHQQDYCQVHPHCCVIVFPVVTIAPVDDVAVVVVAIDIAADADIVVVVTNVFAVPNVVDNDIVHIQ